MTNGWENVGEGENAPERALFTLGVESLLDHGIVYTIALNNF